MRGEGEEEVSYVFVFQNVKLIIFFLLEELVCCNVGDVGCVLGTETGGKLSVRIFFWFHRSSFASNLIELFLHRFQL